MKAQRLLFCIVLFALSFTIARAQGITISGTVYDDGTEGPALGTPTNLVGGKPIYANLSYRFRFDSYGPFYVQASSPVSPDGTYSFTNVINRSNPSTGSFYNYQVSLSTEPGVVNAVNLSGFPDAIKEGAIDTHRRSDYALDRYVTIGTTDLINENLSFNQFPKADNVTAPSQLNPNDASTQITVPTLTGSDPEDGIYNGVSGTNTIAITTIPANGTLFYDGKQISDLFYSIYTPPLYFIYNYDPAKLTVHPNPGDQIILFKYYAVDVAKRWSSSPAQIKMTFTSPVAFYDYGDIAGALENASPSAHHQVVNGLHLGQLIDYEIGPFNSTNADGDDLNNLDDEDGIINNYLPTLSSVSTSYSTTISVLNSLGQTATLSGWIDFNNNGVFEISERAQETVTSNPTNTNVVLSWPNLSTIAIGNLGVRLRLATNASEVETPYGLANNGEVEDYMLRVNPRISGRILIDGNGMTDNMVNGTPWQNQFPTHLNGVNFDRRGVSEGFVAPIAADGTFSFDANSNSTYKLVLRPGLDHFSSFPVDRFAKLTGAHTGIGPGNELIPYTDINQLAGNYLPVAVGNSNVTDVNFGLDQFPTTNDIAIDSQINPLGTNRVQVPTLTGSDPEDGILDGNSGTNTIQIFLNYQNYQQLPYYPDHSWGTLYYNNTPVANGQTIMNYDPTKLTVDPTNGNVTVGFYYKEVDVAGVTNYTVAKVNMPFTDLVSQIDFGDAPNTFKTGTGYDIPTNAYSNGARHIILTGLQLGTLIDAESDGSPNVNSDGDNASNLNDEDGVTSFPIIPGGSGPQPINNYSVSVNVTNNTSGTAYLSGWIDWNSDGAFGPGEIAQATVPAGTNGPATLTWTNQTLTGVTSTTATYARFRLSTDANSVSTPVGDAPDGEVEDYRIPFAAALPVDLVSFRGRWVKGQGNQLSWSTAWERDNDRFEIQSSRDAKSFESIGRVIGKGTTSAAQTYTFVDAQPPVDLTYYRLKQVDTDGHFSYSKIISIRRGVDQTDEQLLIHPNPTSDLLRIQAGKQQNVTDVTIYTALGRRVLHQVGLSSTMSVQSLPAGVYVLEVKTLSGQTLRQRFVKQ